MRKNQKIPGSIGFSILTVDDDPIMTATLKSYFEGVGYLVDVENDPTAAVERVRSGSYDIMLLDFLMTPVCGDQVVEEIRKFNQDLFIILLTGHKSMAPPVKTIRELDIQGYYEKSDRFDQLELLVESCAKSIRQMRLIRRYQKDLSSMVDLLPDLYRVQTNNDLCRGILQKVTGLMDTENGLIVLEEGEDLRSCVLGSGVSRYDGVTPGELLALARSGAGESAPNLLSSPLTSADQKVCGLLAVELPGVPNLYQSQLFSLFARQCSAALGNSALLARLHGNYMEMTGAMRRMVDAKDIYTRGHSDRVAYYAGLLARALGKDKAYCDRLHTAGLFHDIGKLGIPDEILLAARALTDEEFDVIRRHPQKGFDILSDISMFQDILSIVVAHHERIDGRGYPNRLKGEEIPEEARIIAIADSFDAMTSMRRYRPNMNLQQAIDQLVQGKGTQFDADMVEVFLKVLENWEDIQKETARLDTL